MESRQYCDQRTLEAAALPPPPSFFWEGGWIDMTILPSFWIRFFVRDNTSFFSPFGVSAASCLETVSWGQELRSSGSGLCTRYASDYSETNNWRKRNDILVWHNGRAATSQWFKKSSIVFFFCFFFCIFLLHFWQFVLSQDDFYSSFTFQLYTVQRDRGCLPKVIQQTNSDQLVYIYFFFTFHFAKCRWAVVKLDLGYYLLLTIHLNQNGDG